MRVMVTYPPLEGPGQPTLGQNRQFQWFHNPSYIYPMVPASAATMLKEAGHDAYYLDGIGSELSWTDYEQKLLDFRPDLVAIETKTPVVKQHWAIIDKLKRLLPETKIALMGDHVTALPRESFAKCGVDYVFSGGYYDFQLTSLAEHLSGRGEPDAGMYYRTPGGRISSTGVTRTDYDLDAAPLIDRELTNWQLYGEKLYKRTPFTYMMSGRDCPYGKCTFCSWTTLYPEFRARKPERSLEEVGQLVERYGVREIFDDTGTFPPGEWLTKFCRGMIERGYSERTLISCNYRCDYILTSDLQLMKRAGFRLMKMGLESANQATLDRIKKQTTVKKIVDGCKAAKAAGLEVHLTVMVGYPWETRDDARRTLDLARELMTGGYADMLQATVVMSYPGTPLWQDAVKNGWLKFPADAYEKLDMTQPVFKIADMDDKEIMEICDAIYRVFLDPRFVWHHLKRIRSFEDLRYVARGVKPVFGHILDFKR
jgi:anaerobic magnesium-protoporphyrin IX monomethyl ester cyclase